MSKQNYLCQLTQGDRERLFSGCLTLEVRKGFKQRSRDWAKASPPFPEGPVRVISRSMTKPPSWPQVIYGKEKCTPGRGHSTFGAMFVSAGFATAPALSQELNTGELSSQETGDLTPNQQLSCSQNSDFRGNFCLRSLPLRRFVSYQSSFARKVTKLSCVGT